jgi:outer membrane protein assembly factor BamA
MDRARILIGFFLIRILFFNMSFAGISSDSIHQRKIKILPFPDIGYAPETRWYVGGVALFTYKIYKDTITRTTNFKIEFNYTQNKQSILSSHYNIFLRGDSYYFFGDNSFQKFPENFWGIGSNTPDSNLERYDAYRLELNNSFLKQIRKNIYVGPTYRMQYIYKITPLSGGILESDNITGAKGGLSSGLGYTINWDKRDNILNPGKGLFFSLSNIYFGKAFKSDFSFVRIEADLRKYLRVYPRHILALQAYGIFNRGNPPFRLMALMGGENMMRGYYQGRYRDKNYLAFQAEYRMPVWKIFGLTGFTSAGDVASSISSFAIGNFKLLYGLGIRIKVDKRDNVNLRFDYAMGKNTSGLYVVFGEAF